MSKPIVALIGFVVSAAIVLGILQFIVHMQGSVFKIGIDVAVGLNVAGIAFMVVKEPVQS